MTCPRCGNSNPAGAAFCMRCGSPLAAPIPVPHASAAPSIQTDYDAARKRTLVLVGLGALGAALLGFFGLQAAGILRFGASTPDPRSLQATGQAPDNSLLKAKGRAPQQPTFAKSATGGPQMPADVLAWLKHLEETEKRKAAITREQELEMKAIIPQLFTGVGSVDEVNRLSDPDTDLSKSPHNDLMQEMVGRWRTQWQELGTFFNSARPPAECEPIRQAYDQGLSEISATMNDLGSVVSNLNILSPDPGQGIEGSKQSARNIEKGHRKYVDDAFRRAEVRVEEICGKYGMRTWFDIDESGSRRSPLGY